jgi:hypothetical protein
LQGCAKVNPRVLLDTPEGIMAQQAMQIIVGVYVYKERLEVFEHYSERACCIDNDAAAIAAWLEGMQGMLKLAWSRPTGILDATAKRIAVLPPNDGTRSVRREPWRVQLIRAQIARRR